MKRKQEIMEHAIKLFEYNGFDNVTISDINKACGIARGTFYIYFKDKKDLLNCLNESVGAQLYEEILRVCDNRKGNIQHMFSQLIDVVYTYYTLNTGLIEVIQSGGDREFKELFDNLTKKFIPFLSEQFKDEISEKGWSEEDFADIALIKCLTIRSVITQVISYSPEKAAKYKDLTKKMILSLH
jgi:AcrR family transcriptional regulator